jgi:hypothetical protein
MVVISDTAMLADLCAGRNRNGSFCANYSVMRYTDIITYREACALADSQDDSRPQADAIT